MDGARSAGGDGEKQQGRVTRDRRRGAGGYAGRYDADDMPGIGGGGEFKIDLKELQAQEMAMAKFKKAHKKKQEMELSLLTGFANGHTKPESRKPVNRHRSPTDNRTLHDLGANLPGWEFVEELQDNLPQQIFFQRLLPDVAPKNMLNHL